MDKLSSIKSIYSNLLNSGYELLFSEDEFINHLLMDSNYHYLYDRWALSGFSESYRIELKQHDGAVITLEDIHFKYGERVSEVTFEDLENFREEPRVGRMVRRNGVEVKNPTSTGTWKSFERKVATDFGTTRSALSGALKTVTNSDTLHPRIYVECKLRGGDTFKFLDLFELEHTKESPICLHNGDFLLFSSPDFFKVIQKIPYKKIDKPKIPKSILSLYKETDFRAEIEGKIPVVAVKKKNQKGYYLGTRSIHLVELQTLLEIV